MKTKITSLLLALGLAGVGAFSLLQAQPEGGRPHGGPGEGHGPRPVPPLIAALDADRDGTLSATEISNASAALRALDKDHDGALSHEEFMPRPPQGRPGGEGPRGEGQRGEHRRGE